MMVMENESRWVPVGILEMESVAEALLRGLQLTERAAGQQL